MLEYKLSKMPKVAFPSLKKPPFILDESMPIYSPTGFLDITNATLRTSNLEAQNFKLNGGNIYVTSELTTDELLNLDNVVNAGNATSNTVQFTNLTTGLVADSNIVVTGNVTAGSFLGDGSGLTSIPPSAITGTLSQWSDGTNSDVYIASNVGIGNVHTLTSNTLQVGANLYVRDADANVLTVTGNVAADYFEGDGSKLTGISSTLQAITDSGNVTSNTVQFSNATTGFVTTSNIEVGGALKINTITAAAYHSLQAVTNVGNVTSNTVQFSNATTGLVTTGNVEVGRDLSVTGNLTVLGTRTIVDTDTLRVKDPIIELGKDNPGTGDLGLVMTRPSGSSNVGIIFDESESTLEIGYTQGSASDTDITMRTAATEPLDVNVNGNVSVGKELTVSGNVAVDTDTLFVDSVNDRVGVGTTGPQSLLHVDGDVRMKTLSTNAIGKITPVYARGTGNNNVANRIVKIGDTQVVSNASRGLTLTIINASTHAHVSSTDYDTYSGTPTFSDNLASALEAMTDAQIGILTSADAFETMSANLVTAALKLGLTRLAGAKGDGSRHPYVAIFYGAGASGNAGNHAIEVLKTDNGSGAYATLSTFLVDDSFMGQTVTNALYTGTGDSTSPSVFVNRYGNVGIGEANPVKMLHTKGEVVVGTDADNYTNQKGSLYFIRGIGRVNNGFSDRHHYISTRTDGPSNNGNGNNMTFHIDDGTTTTGTSHTTPLKLTGGGGVQIGVSGTNVKNQVYKRVTVGSATSGTNYALGIAFTYGFTASSTDKLVITATSMNVGNYNDTIGLAIDNISTTGAEINAVRIDSSSGWGQALIAGVHIVELF